MRSDKLQDAIGQVRDDYIIDAQDTSIKHRVPLWMRLSIAAAVCLILVSTVPVMVAADNEGAYQFLYAISPAIAQRLKSVHESCEDQGIRMEVISANIAESRADLLVSMQDMTGSRLDTTTDLFDSYSIHTPYDSVGTCSMVGFDEEKGAAMFLIDLSHMAREPLPGDKVTFSIGALLSKKRNERFLLDQIDLSALPVNPRLLTEFNLRGKGGLASSPNDFSVLAPQEKNNFSPTAGVRFTAFGLVNGQLHVQVCYENILETDNHGTLSLLALDGTERQSEYSISFWAENGRDSMEEYVFDVSTEELSELRLVWDTVTCDGAIHGSWQVTVPLK